MLLKWPYTRISFTWLVGISAHLDVRTLIEQKGIFGKVLSRTYELIHTHTQIFHYGCYIAQTADHLLAGHHMGLYFRSHFALATLFKCFVNDAARVQMKTMFCSNFEQPENLHKRPCEIMIAGLHIALAK